MHCQRLCSEIRRDKTKNNQEVTTEVQGKYHNFQQNLTSKEYFVISKVSESQLVFEKCHLRAASSHRLTTRVLSKEKQVWKQKIFQKSRVFLPNLSENSVERFLAQTRDHMNTEETLKVIGRKTLEAIF